MNPFIISFLVPRKINLARNYAVTEETTIRGGDLGNWEEEEFKMLSNR